MIPDDKGKIQNQFFDAVAFTTDRQWRLCTVCEKQERTASVFHGSPRVLINRQRLRIHLDTCMSAVDIPLLSTTIHLPSLREVQLLPRHQKASPAPTAILVNERKRFPMGSWCRVQRTSAARTQGKNHVPRFPKYSIVLPTLVVVEAWNQYSQYRQILSPRAAMYSVPGWT